VKALPVDPERLRRQFPSLTDDDLAAYVEVTGTVLADPQARGKQMAALLARARAAREKAAAGHDLTPEEGLALRYLGAVEKMQGRVGASS
jgi:hypothetical protein